MFLICIKETTKGSSHFILVFFLLWSMWDSESSNWVRERWTYRLSFSHTGSDPKRGFIWLLWTFLALSSWLLEKKNCPVKNCLNPPKTTIPLYIWYHWKAQRLLYQRDSAVCSGCRYGGSEIPSTVGTFALLVVRRLRIQKMTSLPPQFWLEL